jgi:hypothetical protein
MVGAERVDRDDQHVRVVLKPAATPGGQDEGESEDKEEVKAFSGCH